MTQLQTGSPLARTLEQVRTIEDIQGIGLDSPFVGQTLPRRVGGVVTGKRSMRVGERERVDTITVQMPTSEGREPRASDAIVVVVPKGARTPQLGATVQFRGTIQEVRESGRNPASPTTTAVFADELDVLERGTSPERAFELIRARGVEPLHWSVTEAERAIEKALEATELEPTPENFRRMQARWHEALESAFVIFDAGSTLAAASNPFGDFVTLPEGYTGPTTENGAPFQTQESFERRLINMGFSVGYLRRRAALKSGGEGETAYPVGSTLAAPVWGVVVDRRGPQVELGNPAALEIISNTSVSVEEIKLNADPMKHFVVLSLNTFNFDPKVERADRVGEPRTDIDDDIGSKRGEALIDVMLRSDSAFTAIAFQELQDNDGAEQTGNLDARLTYKTLVDGFHQRTGKQLEFAHEVESWKTAGGQPGGNIHLGFAWDPSSAEAVSRLVSIGKDSLVFNGSRKPAAMLFRHRGTGEVSLLVNVHNTSLRHTQSALSKLAPGTDPRDPIRIEQNLAIMRFVEVLERAGISYQITGDFNDTEFGASIKLFEGEGAAVVKPENSDKKADYNHRGVAQNLSHFVVSKADAARVVAVTSSDEQDLGVPMGQLEAPRSSDHGVLWSRMTMDCSRREAHENLDLNQVMQEALEAANDYLADVPIRAREDSSLMIALSRVQDIDDWVELALPQAMERLPEYVFGASLIEDEARVALFGRLQAEAPEQLQSALTSVRNPVARQVVQAALDESSRLRSSG